MSHQFVELLNEFVHRSGYSVNQLHRLSGIPRRTIANWLEGRVQKPRQQASLLKLAATLRLNESEVERLLYLADQPSLQTLQRLAADEATEALLLPWLNTIQQRTEQAPFQVIPDIPYFVGRVNELQILKKRILSGKAPHIYAIQGIAGVGKTALAVRIAYQLRPYFPDGVLWGRLDTTDITATLHSFAQAYGRRIDEYKDLDSQSRVLRELLSNKRTLILLDNVERSEQVLPFLPPSTGHCVVLITTRHRDLDVTLGGTTFVIDPFSHEESLQFFGKTVGEVPVKEHIQDFIALADLLGCLPLALIIAASRLVHEPGQDVTRFLERLKSKQHYLHELTSESQSIKLSFSLSFTSLTRPQQRFFATLGVFEGEDFTVEASAHIAGTTYTESHHLLRQLFMVSLVQVRESEHYALHPLLRLFALHHLDDDAVFTRFVAYFSQFAETHQADAETIAQAFSNITAAIKTAFKRNLYRDAVRTVVAFAPYLINTGVHEKASQYLTQAKSVVEEWGSDTSYLPMIWLQLSQIARMQGHYKQAQDYIEQSLYFAQQNTNEWDISNALCELGVLCIHQGDYKAAETHLQKSLTLAEATEAQSLTGDVLIMMGVLAARLGNRIQAEATFRKGLEVARHLEDKTKLCLVLNNLGSVINRQGKFKEAEAYFQECLTLARQLNHGVTTSVTLNNLALIAQKRGDYAHAKSLIEEGLTLAHRIGYRLGYSQLLVNKGILEREEQSHEAAEKSFLTALQIAREIKHQWQVALVLNELGVLYLETTKLEAAGEIFSEVNELSQQVGDPEVRANALFGLAQVASHQGKRAEGLKLAQESMAIYKASALMEKVEKVSLWLHKFSGSAGQQT